MEEEEEEEKKNVIKNNSQTKERKERKAHAHFYLDFLEAISVGAEFLLATKSHPDNFACSAASAESVVKGEPLVAPVSPPPAFDSGKFVPIK